MAVMEWPFAQADAREELADKLEALYRVMGARGKVRQKRSRPLRAQLVVSCPKAAIALETGTPGAPRLFEVALHQLDCTLLAGSQNSRQLQSGAGPIAIDVSCPANLRHNERVYPSSGPRFRWLTGHEPCPGSQASERRWCLSPGSCRPLWPRSTSRTPGPVLRCLWPAHPRQQRWRSRQTC